jgi:hypothetical protein
VLRLEQDANSGDQLAMLRLGWVVPTSRPARHGFGFIEDIWGPVET